MMKKIKDWKMRKIELLTILREVFSVCVYSLTSAGWSGREIDDGQPDRVETVQFYFLIRVTVSAL